MFREIDDIVETLRRAFERGRKCSVLIGAGCSVTAGIPTAQGFVDIIKDRHPRDYERAEIKTYPYCMAQLSIDEQRSLIAEFVDQAKNNWAHIALAQLMKAGYVDRVLTTNFDPLVMRACALVNEFPATYDLAASQHFEPDKVPEKAIFHLHGQRTGFIHLNSEKALKEHSNKLAPIFDDAGRGRVWIVVGYSGESDPVFDHLANVECFDNKLYWVGYQDNEPASHLRERLLLENKYSYYVKGYDADGFFTVLAQKMECFPPDFVGKPFSYLDGLFDSLTEYTIPKSNDRVNYVQYARQFVRNAIDEIEPIQSDVMRAWADLLSGQYEKVIDLQPKHKANMHPEISDAITWAYISQGNMLLNDARSGRGGYEFFEQASTKYESALKIKPDSHEAFNNWGLTLHELAKTKNKVEAENLFAQANEKYLSAWEIKQDSCDILNNWGNALSDWANTKSGSESNRLFEQAVKKYKIVLKINPTSDEAFNNWGFATFKFAKNKNRVEAEKLFAQAIDKYNSALNVNPNNPKTLNN